MSMFKKVLTVAGFGLAAGLMSGGQADALTNTTAEATANIDVSVDVVAACAFTADGTLAFGNYSDTNGNTGNGSLTVTCTPGSTYAVAVNNGSWHNGTTRRMQEPVSGSFIPYTLCSDAPTGPTPFSCTAFPASVNVVTPLAGGAQTINYWGYINGSLGVLAQGTYSDVVQMSISL